VDFPIIGRNSSACNHNQITALVACQSANVHPHDAPSGSNPRWQHADPCAHTRRLFFGTSNPHATLVL